MSPGKTDIKFGQGENAFVAKDVNALVCDSCDAWYLEPDEFDNLRKELGDKRQIKEAVEELKLVLAGKLTARDAKDLLNEL